MYVCACYVVYKTVTTNQYHTLRCYNKHNIGTLRVNNWKCCLCGLLDQNALSGLLGLNALCGLLGLNALCGLLVYVVYLGLCGLLGPNTL